MAKRDGKVIEISIQEYEEFQGKFGVDNLKTLNSNGDEVPISVLEKNALECIMKAGMFVPDGNAYVVNDKLHAMYFAIHHFMETGRHLDAFDLYCVYSGAFLDDEGDQLENMMNFVASYENGAARLVQNHRDHYVHSAYVFILGLAFFNTQESFRNCFFRDYASKCTKEYESYAKFVDLWGLTALFHDIGYQYEIPFNQILENNKFEYIPDITKIEKNPPEFHYVYFQYQNMDKFTNLVNIFQVYGRSLKNKMNYSKEYLDKYLKALVDNDNDDVPKDIEDVLAYHMKRRLASREYLDRKKIADELRLKNVPSEDKPKKNAYNVYMDHAYYSGLRLFKQMIEIYGLKFCTNANRLSERMDAITAITMHNKFFEFKLRNKKHMQMEEHPLAYLLILCDELQCWDRTSFGKSSLKQFHAIDCEFEFEDGLITANYIFDVKNDAIGFDKNGKINRVVEGPLEKFLVNKGKEDENDNPVKRYIDVINKNVTKDWDKNDCTTWHVASTDFPAGDDTGFLCSINDIVDCTNVVVTASFKKTGNKYCREYLTNISMEDVYALAAKLYESMNPGKKFEDPSRLIQDKLHDIMMIKSVGEILNGVHCFAVKDQRAFERISSFDDFSEDEKNQMAETMKKCQEDFIKENGIMFGRGIVALDLESISRECVECILNTLLAHPGMEVYRI